MRHMRYPDPEQLKRDIEKLNEQMSDPQTSQQPERMRDLSRQLSEKKELATAIEELRSAQRELEDARELADGNDDEMRALAEEDVARLEQRVSELEQRVMHMLVPRDVRDARNVVLEIRAGAGGDEASLFAADLYRAYARYAETQGWKMNVVSESRSDQGGLKEIVAEVSGNNVFGTLKFERGVHRVQRVPDTEKQGRIHTSTVTVAVMPQAEEVDVEIKPEDLRVDTFRASGAGGQHVNKTSSAVRITHEPTGTVAESQAERSQHKNRERAMSILRTRLFEQQEEERRQKEEAERRSQVGTGDRSEKIRTYNYPQDRITDHRIKQSWSNIESVMDGRFDSIFGALQEAELQKKLEAGTE